MARLDRQKCQPVWRILGVVAQHELWQKPELSNNWSFPISPHLCIYCVFGRGSLKVKPGNSQRFLWACTITRDRSGFVWLGTSLRALGPSVNGHGAYSLL